MTKGNTPLRDFMREFKELLSKHGIEKMVILEAGGDGQTEHYAMALDGSNLLLAANFIMGAK